MWLLKRLPEDQQSIAHAKIATAFDNGWQQLDYYHDVEGRYHHNDLVGIDPNKDFNFIP